MLKKIISILLITTVAASNAAVAEICPVDLNTVPSGSLHTLSAPKRLNSHDPAVSRLFRLRSELFLGARLFARMERPRPEVVDDHLNEAFPERNYRFLDLHKNGDGSVSVIYTPVREGPAGDIFGLRYWGGSQKAKETDLAGSLESGIGVFVEDGSDRYAIFERPDLKGRYLQQDNRRRSPNGGGPGPDASQRNIVDISKDELLALSPAEYVHSHQKRVTDIAVLLAGELTERSPELGRNIPDLLRRIEAASAAHDAGGNHMPMDIKEERRLIEMLAQRGIDISQEDMRSYSMNRYLSIRQQLLNEGYEPRGTVLMMILAIMQPANSIYILEDNGIYIPRDIRTAILFHHKIDELNAYLSSDECSGMPEKEKEKIRLITSVLVAADTIENGINLFKKMYLKKVDRQETPRETLAFLQKSNIIDGRVIDAYRAFIDVDQENDRYTHRDMLRIVRDGQVIAPFEEHYLRLSRRSPSGSGQDKIRGISKNLKEHTKGHLLTNLETALAAHVEKQNENSFGRVLTAITEIAHDSEGRSAENKNGDVFIPFRWLDRERMRNILDLEFYKILPGTVHFFPTLWCNFACPGCTAGKSKDCLREHGRDSAQVSAAFDDMKLYIDRFKESGVKEMVFTGGGEPLANEFTIEAMRYAKDIGLDVVLFTNSSLLTDRNIERILDIEPSLLRVSLDAVTPEVHRLFHGLEDAGASHAVLRNVRSMCEKAAGRRKRGEKGSATEISLAVLISPLNLLDLPHVARYVRDIHTAAPGGIDRIVMRPMYSHLGGRQHTQVTREGIEYVRENNPDWYDDYAKFLEEGRPFSREFLATAGRRIERDVLPALKDTGITVSYSSSRFFVPEDNPRYAECLACSLALPVDPDGDVFLCVERGLRPNWNTGNVRHESLREITSGAKRKDAITRLHQGGLQCSGECMLQEYNALFNGLKRFSVLYPKPWAQIKGLLSGVLDETASGPGEGSRSRPKSNRRSPAGVMEAPDTLHYPMPRDVDLAGSAYRIRDGIRITDEITEGVDLYIPQSLVKGTRVSGIRGLVEEGLSGTITVYNDYELDRLAAMIRDPRKACVLLVERDGIMDEMKNMIEKYPGLTKARFLNTHPPELKNLNGTEKAGYYKRILAVMAMLRMLKRRDVEENTDLYRVLSYYLHAYLPASMTPDEYMGHVLALTASKNPSEFLKKIRNIILTVLSCRPSQSYDTEEIKAATQVLWSA
ncbi:radical SAM protein [Candidatus Omnitrophota bacterium]